MVDHFFLFKIPQLASVTQHSLIWFLCYFSDYLLPLSLAHFPSLPSSVKSFSSLYPIFNSYFFPFESGSTPMNSPSSTMKMTLTLMFLAPPFLPSFLYKFPAAWWKSLPRSRSIYYLSFVWPSCLCLKFNMSQNKPTIFLTKPGLLENVLISISGITILQLFIQAQNFGVIFGYALSFIPHFQINC